MSARATNNNTVGVTPDSKTANLVTINFVHDGLTAFGRVWYRGQELSIDRTSADWETTIDPATGKSWLELDEYEQEDKWGNRYFREGKWKGKGFDLDDPELTEDERETLARVEKEGLNTVQIGTDPQAAPVKRGRGRPPKTPRAPVVSS